MADKNVRTPPERWTIISAVAGVAALLIPVALFVLERQSKALTIETVSRARVADVTDPGLSVLKLTYRDKPIGRVTTATIEVKNSGTQPIQPPDFERPLVLRFSPAESLLAATVTERAPANLIPQITLDSSTITISPLLLNPGDRFRLNLVLQGDFDEPTADARIAGIRNVSRTTLREERTTVTGVMFVILGCLATIAYGYLGLLASPIRGKPVALLPTWDAVAVAVVLAGSGAALALSGARILGVSRTVLYWALVPATIVLVLSMILGILRRRGVEEVFTLMPRSDDDHAA